MVVREDKPQIVKRIGKVDFTVDAADGCQRTSREERITALTRWLLAQWRLEREEAQT